MVILQVALHQNYVSCLSMSGGGVLGGRTSGRGGGFLGGASVGLTMLMAKIMFYICGT